MEPHKIPGFSSRVLEIFSTAQRIANVSHPLLENLNHPTLKKIFTFTSQLVSIINHSTMEYLYVSENAENLTGFSAAEHKRSGVELMIQRFHPIDLAFMEKEVFPAYYRHLRLLSPEEQLRMKLIYNFRFLHRGGYYIQVVQESIGLSIEENKLILGLTICRDITRYKTSDRNFYRIVLVNEAGKGTVLETNAITSVFTPREEKVLSLIIDGFSEKQISDILCISLYTVKTHKKNMMKKANVRNVAELASYGMANFMF
jgi:DNA-binding CsgD family transcriptional regulator